MLEDELTKHNKEEDDNFRIDDVRGTGKSGNTNNTDKKIGEQR